MQRSVLVPIPLPLNVPCFFMPKQRSATGIRGLLWCYRTGISCGRVVYGLAAADDDDPVPVAVVPLLIVRVSNRTSTRRF